LDSFYHGWRRASWYEQTDDDDKEKWYEDAQGEYAHYSNEQIPDEGIYCPQCESVNDTGYWHCYRCEHPLYDPKSKSGKEKKKEMEDTVELFFPEITLWIFASSGFRSKDGKYQDKIHQHSRSTYKPSRKNQWASCVDRFNKDPKYRENLKEQRLDIDFCKQVDDYYKSQVERNAAGLPPVISSPVPFAERVERFGHYKRALPAADAAGNTVPRSSIEGYVPYEREVQEWSALGWEDRREGLPAQDSRWQDQGKPGQKGKSKKGASKGSSGSTWSSSNWSAAGAAVGASSWIQKGSGMSYDASPSNAISKQTSNLEFYFLMSIMLVAVLISVIFCFLCCQLYQCRRRKKPTVIWTTGTPGADTYHFDQDCHYVQNKSTKKKFSACKHCGKGCSLI
jgi:hypothetical protein